jgi:hypothetical protein
MNPSEEKVQTASSIEAMLKALEIKGNIKKFEDLEENDRDRQTGRERQT